MGGAEKHLLDLCLQQRALGLQVSVALPAEGELGRELQRHKIEFFVIRAGWRWHPWVLWSLRQTIRYIQPDLVHAHMLKSASMVGYADRHIPCVATAHNIVKRLSPLRHCQHVICVSDMVRDSICQLGYPAEMTTVVHNAVNFYEFNTDKRNEVRGQLGWHGQLIVLCVARLVPAKGQRFAIEALAQLVPHLPHIKLILVGEGPDRQKLTQLADALGVTQYLSILGSRSDVPDLLAATDIYLQPSIKEGFCIAFLEAMASGLVCIGTRTGAIPAMLDSGENGILIQPGEARAIVDAILSIATDTDRCVRFGQAARITAKTQFSLEKQASDTIMVYQRVLDAEKRLTLSKPR